MINVYKSGVSKLCTMALDKLSNAALNANRDYAITKQIIYSELYRKALLAEARIIQELSKRK